MVKFGVAPGIVHTSTDDAIVTVDDECNITIECPDEGYRKSLGELLDRSYGSQGHIIGDQAAPFAVEHALINLLSSGMISDFYLVEGVVNDLPPLPPGAVS